jgi:hypothetical protein
MEFGNQANRLASVRRFANDLEIVFKFEHHAETFAHNGVVIGEQNGDWF